MRARPLRHLCAVASLVRGAAAVLVLGLVTSLVTGACASFRAAPPAPPVPEAVAALAQARALERRSELEPGLDVEDEVRAALERAAALDPSWIAPRRLLDERARAELAGPRLLAERRAALTGPGVTARDLYLVGRLEDARGARRFAQGLALDPRAAWPHHALSVDREIVGDLVGAAHHQARAVERARGGYERALFARRLASLLARVGDEDGARRVLARALEDDDLDQVSRVEVELDLAALELGDEVPPAVTESGYRRALSLVARGATTRAETADLVARVAVRRAGRSEAALLLEVEEALRAHPGLAGDGALLDAVLSGEVWEAVARLRGPQPELGAFEALEAAFRRGAVREGVERWVAELPRQVVGPDGLPADPRLAALVERVRAGEPTDDGARLELGELCLAAGWLGPAAVLARAVDRGADPDRSAAARDLERRALAAEALVAEVEQLLSAAIGEDLAWEPADGPPREPVAAPEAVPRGIDLAGLLSRVGLVAERYGAVLGWTDDGLAARVADSPVLAFGPFGAVVVPGPTFARRDEELGLGTAGASVPGLAEVFDRVGRMALLGQPPFGGVDGTVLRRLLAQERSGEHLGTPWNGLVVHCEGVDAAGRRSRAGLAISGAALHEGYWVDVGAERRRLSAWRAWQRRLEERGAEWVDGLLDDFVLPLDLGAGGLARLERARLAPDLRAADALRLALLAERWRANGGRAEGDLVTLSELVEVVATHEEGHLVDRTRFLPLSRNLPGVLAIAASEGFSPLSIERRLEYRAELVALCCVPDPRLVLVELLEAAGVDARLETVHAHAYRELLEDLLEAWNLSLEADPGAWPKVRRDAYLLHQVHRLAPEEVRELALGVARREGLVRGR